MDSHSLWPHRWITHKAKCVSSDIEGLGVVTIKPIQKGEIVGVLGGVIISHSEIRRYRKKFDHVGIQIEDNFWICPTSREELKQTGVFNHSCSPNIGYLNSITFIAIRDIEPKEELTFDYAFSESFMEPFECNCDSEDCRKIIKPDDWKNKKIQKEYSEYFSPYLKAKIHQP